MTFAASKSSECSKENNVMSNLRISEATFINFSMFLLINTMLIPRLANSLAYALPIPSVEPVTTV